MIRYKLEPNACLAPKHPFVTTVCRCLGLDSRTRTTHRVRITLSRPQTKICTHTFSYDGGRFIGETDIETSTILPSEGKHQTNSNKQITNTCLPGEGEAHAPGGPGARGGGLYYII